MFDNSTNQAQTEIKSKNPAFADSDADARGNVLRDIIDPRQYLGVILQYWWLIFLCLLIGTGLAAAYCVLSTPLYRATCRYELFRDTSLDFSEQSSNRRFAQASLEEELSRQIVIMKSGSLHQRVMERLRPIWEQKLSLEQMRPKIDINRLREAVAMVDIQIDSVSPEYSKAYLEEMLRAYKEMRREEILESTDRAVANLRREQEDIGRELEAAQEALTQFRKEYNLIYTETKTAYDERFLANLVQRENALRMEQTLLESQFDFLENADPATIQDALRLTLETQVAAQDLGGFMSGLSGEATGQAGTAMSNPELAKGASALQQVQWGEQNEWQQVQGQLERLQAEYKGQLDTYHPEHPKMLLLQKDIESARRNLGLAAEIALKRLKARFAAVKLQRQAVREASQAWRRELDLTTEQRAEHAILQAKVNHLSQLYDRVYTRILDGSVVDVDALFNRLVEPVRTIGDPVWPAKIKIMILAVIASLGLGVGGAFAIDHLDTRFLDALAIEEGLKVPYISGVPDWTRVIKKFHPKARDLLVSHDKIDVSTETYRALRASMEHELIASDKPYVLLLTSGEEGEGKTLTTANLAVLFAWTGKKVLLVDGDLRRGSCHQFFDLHRTSGMNEYFMNQVKDWHELVQKTGQENLDFIPAGTYENEVPEALSDERLNKLMDEWRQEYDLIIMDSAPAGQVVDTALLARAADGVLLVVRHGKASYGSVRHALHRLMNANVLGFCLNAIQLGQRKYNYYSRYGRYYYGHYAYPYSHYYYGRDGHAQKTKDNNETASANSSISDESSEKSMS